MIFFKSRKIKSLENRVRDLEFKLDALSTCSCQERVFMPDGYDCYWKEYCPNCKRVFNWFTKETDFLKAKLAYMDLLKKEHEEKINSLEK